ncbi:MAG: DUF5011 domain-containing protein [Acetatifactor sp.]|nr:DUF5011 domain-containing protein [Acetatifactor sp.]
MTVKKRSVLAAYFLESRRWMCHCAIAAGVIGCAAYWFCSQPRFHDLTVELGTETISVEAFMTEFADVQNVGIVTDLSAIDISSAGSYSLTLRSGSRDETVTLTVVDTTPPEAEFISRLEKKPDYKPDPYDFVASCYDLSDVTVYFVGDVVIPLNYKDQSFAVVVEDAYGNAVSQVCTLSIVWLKSEYTVELGEPLNKEDLLFNPERDGCLLGQDDIDTINRSGVGEYTVNSLVDESVCRVRVVDTTSPELVLTDISVFQGEEVTVDSFVESCFDASGEVKLRFTAQPDVDVLGIQKITIEAADINRNTTTATAALAVVKDKTPPVIKGLTTLRVEKRSAPDYLSGVSAIDKVDGACEVTYDAGGVNLTAAGTYYVTYTAKDKDGNIARVKRTVVVEHDQADTDALADSVAAGLGSDPEAIRDYVRDTIKYSHNSGGKDPVWYGFTSKSGDCLVHARCLQSLLTRKGYETQLIWVTDRSHYWLIINLNGVWRHIDATPGVRHTKYSLMTDEQRYSILQGRDWDRSAWPACE